MSLELAAGVWLEQRAVCLNWGATLGTLRQETNPDFGAECPSGARLAWNDSVLDGLDCQVTTVFGGKTYPQATLHWLHVVVRFPVGIRGYSDGFRWLNPQLVRKLGPPQSYRHDGEQGEAVWHIGDVTLRHEYIDGFVGYHCILVYLGKYKRDKANN